MIIDYDRNPQLNTDRKLDSLKESVQMALNENDAEHKGFRALFDKVNATIDSIKSQIADILNRLGQDFIVEQGTSGDWVYRKWNSGVAECWGTKSESKALSSWGSWYYVRIDGIDYPTNLFTTLLNVTGSLQWAGGDLVSGLTTRPSAYNVTAPNAIGIRPNNLSGTYSATAFWYAVGKWK